MLRRHVLGLGGVLMVGEPIEHLGELLELPEAVPEPVPLPSRLNDAHVVQVRELTQRLEDLGRAHGSNPGLSSAAAVDARRLLGVPGAERVRQALMVSVAELHVHAGWSAFDAGLYTRSMYHYARALELACEVGDVYLQALAMTYAGLATVEHGHPDDGLKMLQAGQVKSWEIPLGEKRDVLIGISNRAALGACGLADSATALAALACPDAADRAVQESQQLWTPANTDSYGALDNVIARLELDRGRLDTAEPFAAASVRRWEGINNQRARTQAGIVLATIHVQAGEQNGLQLAHSTITGVAKLTSVRVRRRLHPLAAALEARPGSDTRELARLARQVAA